jgi:hypothetical protein
MQLRTLSLAAPTHADGRRRRRAAGDPTATPRCPRGRPLTAAAAEPTAIDYDRIPALFVSDDAFSLSNYWDKRYEQGQQQQEDQEEWYRGGRCMATQAVVVAHLELHLPVLQVGVGLSRLQEEMVQPGFGGGGEEEEEDGDASTSSPYFRSVLSTDFSPVAVQMQQRRLEMLLANPTTSSWASRLSYLQADARRRLEGFEDGHFAGGVLDKGTLDALLCGDDADQASSEMLAEVWRLLPAQASYVMITSAAPAARRRLLPTAAGLAVGSPTPPPSFPIWSAAIVYRLGQGGALSGPAVLGDDAAEAALLAAHEEDERFAYSHYAYVCVK